MAPNPKPARPALPDAPSGAPAPHPTFPIAALGPLLSNAVTAVAAQTQAPLELVAHHILTLGAMAAQRLRLLNLLEPALTDEEKEEILRRWVGRRPADEVLSLRELCRLGPKELRCADTLYDLMRRMERWGIVQAANESFGGPGVRRRPGGRYAWRIVGEAGQSVA